MAYGSRIRKYAALLAFGFFCAALSPACVIKIEKGGDPGNSAQGGAGASTDVGATAGAGGAGGLSPEEEADIALAQANPDELARVQLRSQYASYLVEGYVNSNVSDPANIDTTALQALIEEYAPTAWDEAGQWVDTLDPALIPLAMVKPKYECQQQFGCPATDICSFDGYAESAYCVVTGCGEGACPSCPSIFDLDKLIVKGWCSYTCMVGYEIVGIKVRVMVALFGEFSKCLKLEKPVPCEGTCKP